MLPPQPPSPSGPVRDVPSSESGTTCWGLLGQCASPEPAQAAAALAAVCWRYRPAVLAYARAHTASVHDAEDLTQGFFAFLLERQLFLHADPARGRFRAFLFTCLHRYLNGEADRQRAAKRGGGVVLLPLDEASEEGMVGRIIVLSPLYVRRRAEEAHFDRHWASALLDSVQDDLAAECDRAHGVDTFRHLAPFLPGGAGENTEEGHQQAALALGLSLKAFRAALHRMRLRHKVLVREAVTRTVIGSPGEVEAELRHLVAAAAAAGVA